MIRNTLLIVALLAAAGASRTAAETPDPGIAPFDAKVKGRVLASLYGGGGMNFAWGALNFTGRPRTVHRWAPLAGVRVAYPILWWGGPIISVEWARRDLVTENRSWAGRVRTGQRLECLQLLAGWRQYTAWTFYGTGIVAGYNAGPWSNRVVVNGTDMHLAGFGGGPGVAGRLSLGIYTEIGAMVPLGGRVTLDLAAQLQGFLVPALTSRSPLHRGARTPMVLNLIAGVTVRTP